MPQTLRLGSRRGGAGSDFIVPLLALWVLAATTGRCASIQYPMHEWALRAGGAGFDIAQAVAADASGNAYISGFFTEPASFGPFRLTNSGPSDAFVAKLDPQGNVLWAMKPTGSGSDYSGRIAVTPQGEVSVTGSSASSRLTFGEVTVTNHPGGGSFLARLDSAGRFVWGLRTARYSGILFSSFPDAVAVDDQGSSYVAGQFDGRMTLGDRSLTNRAVDVYLAKVRSDATVEWVSQAGGTGDDLARDVAVDRLGNVYACGFFLSSRATFGTTTLTNRGVSALWVAKWDPAGTVLWARTAAGKGADSARAVCVDREGSVYLGGYLGPFADFGGIVLTNSSGRDLFLTKLDPDGRFLWATNANNSLGSGINDLALDVQGNPVAAGDFGGRLTLGSLTLTNATGVSGFVAMWSRDGAFEWAVRTGEATSPEPNSLAIETGGSIYSVGTHDRRSVIGSQVLTNQGSDIYVTRIVSRPELHLRNLGDGWVLSWPASVRFPAVAGIVEQSVDCSHWEPLLAPTEVAEIGQTASVVELKLLQKPSGGTGRYFRLRSQ